MRYQPFLPLLIAIAGCTEVGPPADQPGVREPDDAVMAADARPAPPPTDDQRRIDHLARMKGAIRLHAAADFASHCRLIDIPDRAFIPIELNGDTLPELAVAFGRVTCSQMGATGFSSTGGLLVQFWSQFPEDRPARLLTQAHMLGFTPGNRMLITQQHGAECGLPGAAGCQVTYRWRTQDLAGMTVERRPGGVGQRMAYGELEGPSNLPEDGKRDRAEQLARLRAAIRQDARLNYGEYCGPIELPDSAFYEVEITGDDFPELAVSLARAICPAQGATGFQGTGGAKIQFWHMARDYQGRDGPTRLLLETHMRGFTPRRNVLVTLQHGVKCPGGAGPDLGLITYRWDEKTTHLDAVERRFRPKESPSDMRFGDEKLW